MKNRFAADDEAAAQEDLDRQRAWYDEAKADRDAVKADMDVIEGEMNALKETDGTVSADNTQAFQDKQGEFN
jgi:hypothetical protein